MKWLKVEESKIPVFAPGIAIDVEGFTLMERLDTRCRAFLFIDQSTNDAGHGLHTSEISEKVSQLQGRMHGVVLVTKRIELPNHVQQLVLAECDDVEESLKIALTAALKGATGFVIGLYRTKGGVGLHSLARMMQLHLKDTKLDVTVYGREQRYGFHAVNANQLNAKVEQARAAANCVIVIDPTASMKVDRKVLIADQTAVSVDKIKEEGGTYDAIVINRYADDVIPKEVFLRNTGVENLIFIPEDLAVRVGSMMGQLDDLPKTFQAELQAIYM